MYQEILNYILRLKSDKLCVDCLRSVLSLFLILDSSLDSSKFCYMEGANIATLGPEEKPILSQRDEGWAEEWHYFHPASQPATHPATQPATHLSI